MDYLWIIGLVLVLDAFVLAYLRGSGKVPNLPLVAPVSSFVVGAALFVWSMLA